MNQALNMNPLLKNSHKVFSQKFYQLNSFKDIADLLEVDPTVLWFYIYKNKLKNYNSFTIPKKTKGTRTIDAPIKGLKILQKKLSIVLNEKVVFKKCCFGFIKDRDIKKNAKLHEKSKYILNIDLENFFPSITRRRIKGLFKSLPFGFNEVVAEHLSHLVTYQDRLPQGSPCSPLISNLICWSLDKKLLTLSKKYRLIYTRYCDDLTFSSKTSQFSEVLLEGLFEKKDFASQDSIKKIIESNGFLVNPNKIKLKKYFMRQEVTGLIVNKFPNLKREYLKLIRAKLHNLEKNGYEIENEKFQKKVGKGICFKKHLKSCIEYIGYIRGREDDIYSAFLMKLGELAPELFSPGEYSRKILPRLQIDEKLKDSLMVIEGLRQGTAFFSDKYGWVTCNHCLDLSENEKLIAYYPWNQGERYEVTVLRKSEKFDLALIHIDIKPNKPLTVSNCQIEQFKNKKVHVVGFPKHSPGKATHTRTMTEILNFSYYAGVRNVNLDRGLIQGMSGGPILNEKNEVIAVVHKGAENISEQDFEDHLAIDIKDIEKI